MVPLSMGQYESQRIGQCAEELSKALADRDRALGSGDLPAAELASQRVEKLQEEYEGLKAVLQGPDPTHPA